ncbi:hypothetical protein Tmar_0852 [Thermaerobacter marianensis DSM 12885]|uniref:Uncharacterized protein n=1 Tax=Thermaerobacter marianensis (strain ATCC 700841 / DSM 12885 / JCM 10246 / 7p75a) TaxID=644966 RepID=E6SIX1_THEM7|nr:hypothetical protein Tmar_0852 [Thermaerobacter marianensis DSM 12885]
MNRRGPRPAHPPACPVTGTAAAPASRPPRGPEGRRRPAGRPARRPGGRDRRHARPPRARTSRRPVHPCRRRIRRPASRRRSRHRIRRSPRREGLPRIRRHPAARAGPAGRGGSSQGPGHRRPTCPASHPAPDPPPAPARPPGGPGRGPPGGLLLFLWLPRAGLRRPAACLAPPQRQDQLQQVLPHGLPEPGNQLQGLHLPQGAGRTAARPAAGGAIAARSHRPWAGPGGGPGPVPHLTGSPVVQRGSRPGPPHLVRRRGRQAGQHLGHPVAAGDGRCRLRHLVELRPEQGRGLEHRQARLPGQLGQARPYFRFLHGDDGRGHGLGPMAQDPLGLLLGPGYRLPDRRRQSMAVHQGCGGDHHHPGQRGLPPGGPFDQQHDHPVGGQPHPGRRVHQGHGLVGQRLDTPHRRPRVGHQTHPGGIQIDRHVAGRLGRRGRHQETAEDGHQQGRGSRPGHGRAPEGAPAQLLQVDFLTHIPAATAQGYPEELATLPQDDGAVPVDLQHDRLGPHGPVRLPRPVRPEETGLRYSLRKGPFRFRGVRRKTAPAP